MKRLGGMVAIVTGASRGGGRGIALVLGEEGAVVYVTGRSSRTAQTGSTRPDLLGTCIEDTAEMVTARGGVGIPIQCDHTIDSDVEKLFDRVRQEQGKLDLLVNNVWGGYEKDPQRDFDSPFWEQPTWRWDAMFTSGVRAHYVASQHAARMMIPRRRGLIISTTFWDRGKYFTPLPYYLSKLAINRMMYAMSLELREHGVSTVALSPGWMRTEAVMADMPPNTRPSPEEFDKTESVEYIGRAVVALCLDPRVSEKSGTVCLVGDLSREYGFTDVDGRQVPPFTIPDEYLLD